MRARRSPDESQGRSGAEAAAGRAPDPVGLEYTVRVVTCVSRSFQDCQAAILVLVRESAEDLFSADLVLGQIDYLRRPGVSLSRRELAEGTVRQGGVVLQQVLGQHLSQMALIDD
jgi:hypothetical protein